MLWRISRSCPHSSSDVPTHVDCQIMLPNSQFMGKVTATTGTGRRRSFASRQGRRTGIRNRTNPGPAPFQGAWSCRGVSGGYASLRHRLISLAPPALEEFASSIPGARAPKAPPVYTHTSLFPSSMFLPDFRLLCFCWGFLVTETVITVITVINAELEQAFDSQGFDTSGADIHPSHKNVL